MVFFDTLKIKSKVCLMGEQNSYHSMNRQFDILSGDDVKDIYNTNNLKSKNNTIDKNNHNKNDSHNNNRVLHIIQREGKGINGSIYKCTVNDKLFACKVQKKLYLAKKEIYFAYILNLRKQQKIKKYSNEKYINYSNKQLLEDIYEKGNNYILPKELHFKVLNGKNKKKIKKKKLNNDNVYRNDTYNNDRYNNGTYFNGIYPNSIDYVSDKHNGKLNKTKLIKKIKEEHPCYENGNSILLMDTYKDVLTLNQIINVFIKKNYKNINEEFILYIIYQLIIAVLQLHSLSVLHGDIKIDNILIVKNEKKMYNNMTEEKKNLSEVKYMTQQLLNKKKNNNNYNGNGNDRNSDSNSSNNNNKNKKKNSMLYETKSRVKKYKEYRNSLRACKKMALHNQADCVSTKEIRSYFLNNMSLHDNNNGCNYNGCNNNGCNNNSCNNNGCNNNGCNNNGCNNNSCSNSDKRSKRKPFLKSDFLLNLFLIDIGRGIDMNNYKKHLFYGNKHCDCYNFLDNSIYNYHIDFIGIAQVASCLLFLKHIGHVKYKYDKNIFDKNKIKVNNLFITYATHNVHFVNSNNGDNAKEYRKKKTAIKEYNAVTDMYDCMGTWTNIQTQAGLKPDYQMLYQINQRVDSQMGKVVYDKNRENGDEDTSVEENVKKSTNRNLEKSVHTKHTKKKYQKIDEFIKAKENLYKEKKKNNDEQNSLFMPIRNKYDVFKKMSTVIIPKKKTDKMDKERDNMSHYPSNNIHFENIMTQNKNVIANKIDKTTDNNDDIFLIDYSKLLFIDTQNKNKTNNYLNEIKKKKNNYFVEKDEINKIKNFYIKLAIKKKKYAHFWHMFFHILLNFCNIYELDNVQYDYNSKGGMDTDIGHTDYGKKHTDYGKKHTDYGKKHTDYDKKHTDYGTEHTNHNIGQEIQEKHQTYNNTSSNKIINKKGNYYFDFQTNNWKEFDILMKRVKNENEKLEVKNHEEAKIKEKEKNNKYYFIKDSIFDIKNIKNKIRKGEKETKQRHHSEITYNVDIQNNHTSTLYNQHEIFEHTNRNRNENERKNERKNMNKNKNESENDKESDNSNSNHPMKRKLIFFENEQNKRKCIKLSNDNYYKSEYNYNETKKSTTYINKLMKKKAIMTLFNIKNVIEQIFDNNIERQLNLLNVLNDISTFF
ncbi:conserved protein, unknown function, partial [Hepatocystis sp. ex Piliocolobus tephrosceles]